MTILEFTRTSGYALAFSFGPMTAEAFADELKEAKAALLDWHAQRGERCEVVMFSIAAAADNQLAIEGVFDRFCRDEDKLAALLKAWRVEVVILDQHGEPVKQFALAHGLEEKNAAAWN